MKSQPITSTRVGPELMRNYIETHYNDLKACAISITRSSLWEELLQETLLALLSAKSFPSDIFERGREFVYIYSVMKMKLYVNKAAFISAHSFKGHHSTKYNLQHYNIKEEIPIDTPYSFEQEVIFNSIFDGVRDMQDIGIISEYQMKCFLLYYFPEQAPSFINLSKASFLQLVASPTYRTIEHITGISFQSIRNTVLKVLKKIKEHIPEFDSDFSDPTERFHFNIKQTNIKKQNINV